MAEHRESILKRELPDAKLWIFDEPHNYFRDTDGREVDFVIIDRRRPKLFIECKWGDADVDRSLRYLKVRFPEAEAWQVSAAGRKDYLTSEGIRVSPALAFLNRLI